METMELAEHLDDVDETTTYYELLISDPGKTAWFACNCCGTNVDNSPCEIHAPRDIPGLVQAECSANPPHWPVFVLDGDHCGYGVPCPHCEIDRLNQQIQHTRQCAHWAWRRWRITGWSMGWVYKLGLASGAATTWGDGCDGCQEVSWHGKRVYILGVRREVWRCWAHGHRRGDEVGFGYCGKCVPWTCCGSTGELHTDGCREAVAA